jgi:hypothetical protein
VGYLNTVTMFQVWPIVTVGHIPLCARHLSIRALTLEAVACGEWLRLLLTDHTSSILSYATKKTHPRNFHAAYFVTTQL